MKLFLCLLVGAVFANTVTANELTFESGDKQTVMVELFTSEGCNSCPPAERQLNQYRKNPQLWKIFIPVAWHVDYWDYLGWKDRFSSAAYSDRQRRYARVHRSNTVYTPNFVVNGLNWRPGIFSGLPQPATGSVGNLKVKLKNGILSAHLMHASALPKRLQLNVALLGMGLVSNIKAGENAGRRALHEFVALSHQTADSTDSHWQLALGSGHESASSASAIAVWVSRPGDPVPLQAAGAPLAGHAIQD